MPSDDVRLLTAVQLVRELIRDGMPPAPAAAPMRLLGFDVERARRLATIAEHACREARAALHAESSEPQP